jgi:hypothetical protein
MLNGGANGYLPQQRPHYGDDGEKYRRARVRHQIGTAWPIAAPLNTWKPS